MERQPVHDELRICGRFFHFETLLGRCRWLAAVTEVVKSLGFRPAEKNTAQSWATFVGNKRKTRYASSEQPGDSGQGRSDPYCMPFDSLPLWSAPFDNP